MPEHPTPNENLQILIDAYFRQESLRPCTQTACNGQNPVTTTVDLIDPKKAIVLSINRQQDNPMWPLVTPEERVNYPGIKIDRKVMLSNVIKIPCARGVPAQYELVATIEHSGDHTGGGHYVTHLKYNDTWYLANDKEPIRKSIEFPEFDVEKSNIFLFKILNISSDME